MKRYSIMCRENGAKCEFELCQCDSSPEEVVEAAKRKPHPMYGKKVKFYEHVYYVDNKAQEV